MFKLGPKGGFIYEQSEALTAGGLVGSRWKRREPIGDDPYDHVEIVGFTPVLDGVEIVYRPVSFGESLQAETESFTAIYTRGGGDETTSAWRDIERRLQGLQR